MQDDAGADGSDAAQGPQCAIGAGADGADARDWGQKRLDYMARYPDWRSDPLARSVLQSPPLDDVPDLCHDTLASIVGIRSRTRTNLSLVSRTMLEYHGNTFISICLTNPCTYSQRGDAVISLLKRQHCLKELKTMEPMVVILVSKFTQGCLSNIQKLTLITRTCYGAPNRTTVEAFQALAAAFEVPGALQAL